MERPSATRRGCAAMPGATTACHTPSDVYIVLRLRRTRDAFAARYCIELEESSTERPRECHVVVETEWECQRCGAVPCRKRALVSVA